MPTKTNETYSSASKPSRGKNPKDGDAELVAKCNRLYNSAQDSRKLLDWKWFIYDLWVSGNHYAKYDRGTQQIITSVKDDGRPKVVINKVYTALRTVRNYALRNKPRAEVTPGDLTPDNISQTIKLNKYLDYLHDRLNLRRKLKSSMWHALKYSVGFWQVLWDEDGEDGQGEVEVNEIDPYDLYWDPNAKHPGEARFACLAIRRNLDDLRNDPKYKGYKDILDNLETDKQMAASNLKARMLQFESGTPSGDKKSEGSIIVKEFWFKEYDKDHKSKIRIVTMAGDQIIRNEDTDLDRIPFFRLPSDIEPMSMYGQGWAKNIIPVNRLLDRLESQLAEYNDIMNKGKWVTDKGSGVRIINNENGQIIEKKRGYEVRQEPIAPPSAVLIQQIESANRYIEDMAAVHDATAGRIPTGAKSGNAIEALQQGDSNNLSEITENLEEFLEGVYEYILLLAAQKYQFMRNVTPMDNTGQREFIQVIGEDAGLQPEGAVVISKKNMVDVKVSSWMANTPEARRQAVSELANIMLANQTPLDPQTILEAWETGNIADIIERMNKQKEQQQVEQLAQEQASASLQPQGASSGTEQAIAAIRSIIQGQPPVQPPSASPEFINYIDQFLQSEEAQTLPPETLQAIQIFRDQVAQTGLGQPPTSGSAGQPPQPSRPPARA